MPGRAIGHCPAVRRLDGSWQTAQVGRPLVMGILNLTPDSFSDGGQYDTPQRAVARAHQLIADGADLLDLGAESTRPGATTLPPAEEQARLLPVLQKLADARLPVALSVDTRNVSTARLASSLGVRMLNLPFPQEFAAQAISENPASLGHILASFDAVVVMHARGTPATMRQLADYPGDLRDSVLAELRTCIGTLLAHDPSLRSRLLFDPGLGFAKTAQQSFSLLAQLDTLASALAIPVVVGASRKSMLAGASGLPVEKRLIPSVAAATLAAWLGAAVLRVHDVAETAAALAVVQAMSEALPSRHVLSTQDATLGAA